MVYGQKLWELLYILILHIQTSEWPIAGPTAPATDSTCWFLKLYDTNGRPRSVIYRFSAGCQANGCPSSR